MPLRRKTKPALKETTGVPQLNETAYVGVLESENERVRFDRKNHQKRLSANEVWKKYRQQLSDDIVSGYSKFLYGGFWIRLFAFLCDLLIVWALRLALFGLFDFFAPEPVSSFSPIVIFCVKQIILILYFTFSSYILNGQTLGKALCDLQVVNNHEEKLSFMTCFVREGLGKFILIMVPFLGLFVIFTNKRENFIDFFTNTNVISLKQFLFLYEENRI